MENFSNSSVQWQEVYKVMFVLQLFMTFRKNYESIFVETTWLIYREEYLSEFKWNCYLTTKKFALTEMAMEPFSHYGSEPSLLGQIAREQRACWLSCL